MMKVVVTNPIRSGILVDRLAGERIQPEAGDYAAARPTAKSVRASKRADRRRSEAGNVLILALIYITAISLVVGALANWAMNDLNNSTHFQSASSADYAASSAAQVAIQSIRYTPLMAQTKSPSLGYCWTPSSGYVSQLSNINGYTMATWCSTVQNLASAQTRVVTFYVCQSSLTAGSSSADVLAAGLACKSSPRLLATVAFDDYPPGGSTPLTQTCTTWCGEGATTQKWTWAS